MALETKPFRNLPQLPNGTSVADNIKLTDCLPFQHTDINEGVNSFNKITMGQMLCEPVATAGAISGDTYSATCSNYPDFAISYTDEQQNSHYYVGMKVRVVFNNGITYGSVSGGTYPKLNINNSGALPLLAQGKTMASGACSTGQSLEFTLIPYGNGVAWDADSNVRESTSDYTIYTDGGTEYKKTRIDYLLNNIGFKKVSEGENEYTPSAMGVYIAIGHALGNANYRGLIVKIILFGGTAYPANTNKMATLIEATTAGNSSITYDTTTGKITYSSSFAHTMDVYKMGVR